MTMNKWKKYKEKNRTQSHHKLALLIIFVLFLGPWLEGCNKKKLEKKKFKERKNKENKNGQPGFAF